MQVYGTQSRMRKYTSLPRRAAIDNKFSQIVARLDDLTKQVWALSAGDSPDPAGTPHPRHVFGQCALLQCIQFLTDLTVRQSRRFLQRQSCPKAFSCSVMHVVATVFGLSMVLPAPTGNVHCYCYR